MDNQTEQVTAVRNAWRADPDIGQVADHLQIDAVDTSSGRHWRISGDVPNVAARRKAARLARETLPAIAIEDNVCLEPAIRESDEALGEAVRSALRSEQALQDIRVIIPGERPPIREQPWIGVIVSGSVIRLGGLVESMSTAALAEAVAWETCACRDVRNTINYDLRRETSDEAIALAATTLIREHPRLDDQPIHVEVTRGEARLTGTVGDGKLLDLAKSLCWLAPSIREVHSEIEIAGDMS